MSWKVIVMLAIAAAGLIFLALTYLGTIGGLMSRIIP